MMKLVVLRTPDNAMAVGLSNIREFETGAGATDTANTNTNPAASNNNDSADFFSSPRLPTAFRPTGSGGGRNQENTVGNNGIVPNRVENDSQI